MTRANASAASSSAEPGSAMADPAASGAQKSKREGRMEWSSPRGYEKPVGA